MRNVFLLSLWILFVVSVRAQYPFEAKPHIRYMHYTHWKLLDTSERRAAYIIGGNDKDLSYVLPFYNLNSFNFHDTNLTHFCVR
jgi:hypothetical protein